jgi:hypothetical protein
VRIIRNLLAIITLMPLLAACADLGMRRPVPNEAAQTIKNIAVYSSFEPAMNHVYIGTTVFSNTKTTRSVPEWQIASYAESETVKALKEMGIGQKVSVLKAEGVKRPPRSLEDIKHTFKAAHAAGYDTLIWLDPSGYDNARFMEKGYGLFKRSAFGMGSSCAYALFTVYAVDTANAKDLGWQWGFDSWNEGPCSKADAPWKDNVSDLTPEEMRQVEAIIKEKIAKGVRSAIAKLELKGEAQSPQPQ